MFRRLVSCFGGRPGAAIWGMLVAWLLCGFAAAPLQSAAVPVEVTIASEGATGAIPPGFAGLSYELSSILPAPDGRHYFQPNNAGLVALFRSLGIENLRIGGNTSDRNVKDLPARNDLDELFGFARAAGVKVIYCLRLHDGDPAADAATVKYLVDRYGPLVDCFSIGQEPSAYPVGPKETRAPGNRMGASVEKFPYEVYRDEWRRFAKVIIEAVPDVRFCGPSVHNNPKWTDRFISDFGTGWHVTLITAHLYPGGAAAAVPSDAVARDWMLSSHFSAACERLYRGIAPQLGAMPYRLEETNSYYNGGRLGASDTFTAALWGLDYLYWWAEHGAAGINFHTGDGVSMNGQLHVPAYGVFTSRTDGYDIRPLAYALKAFRLAGHGSLSPVKLRAASEINLSAYAVRSDDNLTVTLINRTHDKEAREAAVTLNPGSEWTSAEVVFLRDSGGVAAVSGITLGDAPIDERGGWAGHWRKLPSTSHQGGFSLSLPAASAAIIRLRKH